MYECNCTDMQHANLIVPSAMRQALKRLGYVDTYHMYSVFENPPDCDMWKEAFAAKSTEKARNSKGRTGINCFAIVRYGELLAADILRLTLVAGRVRLTDSGLHP